MGFARVRSIEGLAGLKAALCTFAAEAKEALSAAAMDIRRAQSWLDDQYKYWTAAVRKSEDAVFHAKQELSRRRMTKIGDRRPDCTEQEGALELARRRLEYAEDKLEATRRWQRQLPEAILDYEGPVNQLLGFIDGQLPKADALLTQKIAALEEYVRIATEGAAAPPSPAPRGEHS
jgi:chromosome segregation ATPase